MVVFYEKILLLISLETIAMPFLSVMTEFVMPWIWLAMMGGHLNLNPC